MRETIESDWERGGLSIGLGKKDSKSFKTYRNLWHQQSGLCSNQHLGHIGMPGEDDMVVR